VDLGRTSLVGRTLAHYRISTAIGAGGMGEVYRATDTKLARDIALKVLPLAMSNDPDRLARFQREARAVAALNHPNVVTVYSVEESDNVHFITMELLEGEPLDRLISANGLPSDRIIEIAGAIAEALAAAHEKGIVHRDLKPANVMVTNEGRVKVLDFGLAKDIGGETTNGATMASAGYTQAGMVMGTPAYMSPEQVSGRPLDHRSDIFSFGVMLHEMATGRRPFEGNSSAELISSILRDSPPSVTDARPELSSDIARVIRRCLEKEPRHRVQTARDVSNEFRDLARTISRPTPVSTLTGRIRAAADSGAARADEGFWVAVLPFKYSGNNQDLKALAEGLSEEVVTGMSRFSYLRVIARASTAKYSGESGDVRAIGKELGARYVMEGSLRQAGAKVRIAVQLVDSASGASLWAETYDRAFTPEAMLDLLDDVVPRIVATVGDTQGILAHSMTEALRNRNPESLTPYEALLRSFGFHQHVSEEEHAAGIKALEKAVRETPDRAECWAMLSWLYRAEYTHGYNERPNAMDRALEAAQRAVKLAPSNQLAHAALASVHFFRHEFGSFRIEAERTLALNRMEGYTTAFLGLHFAYSGDWERGCALCEAATQLNPNHPGWYWLPLAINAYRGHDGERALQYVLKVNMPGLWTAQVGLAVIYSQLGQMEQAQSAVRSLLASRPGFAASAQKDLRIWWQPDMVEQMLGDLRRAGLDVPENTAPISQVSGFVDVRTTSGESRANEGFWVAVLPFKYSGGSGDLKALAEGLTDEIITGLSRFSYLRVIARGSTAKYSSESGDVRTIGKDLGARYVMEGSLRHAGTKLRLAVQLADATTGSHVWAETYERTLNPETVFELQDELVPRIVSTVADAHGILPHTMGESIRSKNPEQLSPYEAVLRCFSYAERISPEEHAIARSALERAVEISPTYAYAWALLSLTIKDEFESGFNPKPDSLERMLKTARRAVELDPSGHRGYHALAIAHFHRKEVPAFRTAADRAIALNPLDGCNVAHLGSFIAYAGEWERGCGLVERALQLNPNHPGWYWFPLAMNAYRKNDYQAALGYALKINLPNFLWTHTMLAAIYGQLGQQEEAGKSVQELLKLNPRATQIVGPAWRSRYDPELVDRLIDGLRKAGFDVSDDAAPSSALSSGRIAVKTASGESRTSEGFWVAVLPFKYTGSTDLKPLAEGLTDEIITGLSRFSYLRVIARGSTVKYSTESGDVRAIGKELGARYVMEGSLRQAGAKLRLTVQLADTVSGTHLWAETYERAFAPEAIFDLQDDLVPRIVATIADQYGVLPRSMSEVLRSKSEDALTAHEAVLRTFSYFGRIGPEEHAIVRRILERAVREAPDYAESWAMLSMIYRGEFAQGYNAGPNPLDRALAAAQRAVDLAPTNALCHYALATVYYFRKETVAFRTTAERCLALNPMDGSAIAYLGMLTATTGEWDRGCAMVDAAMKLNPNYPGWFQIAIWANAYRKGKYEEALEAITRVNLPGYFHAQAARAATLGKLGRKEEAQKALQDLLALRPDFASVARQEYAKWYDAEHIEQIVDGLRKAGMECPGSPRRAATVDSAAG
jgi:TolB-like protein/Tfp pilus assembly protein PilF